MKTYTKYSIGCFAYWAIALAITARKGKIDKAVPVFAGWVIGWLSATVGRAVYPPPRSKATGGLTPSS